MGFTLSDDARQYIALFDEETGVTARDCVIEDDRVVFLVSAGKMADAIGPGGKTVRALEDRLGTDVTLVENALDAESFVANMFAPAVVSNVTISVNDTTVAYVEIPDEDKGVAIGAGGRNIDLARRMAARHYDIDDIELT